MPGELHLGVDVGGTNTDAVIVDRQGRVRSVVFGECDWNASPAHDWVAAAL